MLEAPELPDHLLLQADDVGTGELLWPPSAAGDAVRWMAAQGLGVLGGEVYARIGGAEASFERDWLTERRDCGREPWGDYVERAAGRALEIIDGDMRDGYQPLDDGPVRRRYFLAVCRDS